MTPNAKHTLRLVTINTWKCDGAYNRRLVHLERSLRRLRPDVICCQEVFQSRDGHHHTGRFLADRLGLQIQSLPLRQKKRRLKAVWTESYSGLAVLSAWTIATHTALCLPTRPEDGDRYALFAVLQRRDRSILVVNTHLSHLPDATQLRISQLETIVSHPHIRAGHDAIFLCGDFNATPLSREIQYLTHHPDLAVIDAAGRPHAITPMVTFPVSAPIANRDAHPDGKRIDYVFCLSQSADARPMIEDVRVVLDQPSSEGIFASDHYGVMIDATLWNRNA
jgi:endonuclease/exonuclease/phosphatase family metal-dependent hydrolase